MKLEELIFESEDIESFANMIKEKYGLLKFDLYLNRYGQIELQMIEVPKTERSVGAGSAAIKELINYADRNGHLIWMSIADKNATTGTTSKNRLKKFYKQFGFVENKGRNKDFSLSRYAEMYRLPKSGSGI